MACCNVWSAQQRTTYMDRGHSHEASQQACRGADGAVSQWRSLADDPQDDNDGGYRANESVNEAVPPLNGPYRPREES